MIMDRKEYNYLDDKIAFNDITYRKHYKEIAVKFIRVASKDDLIQLKAAIMHQEYLNNKS